VVVGGSVVVVVDVVVVVRIVGCRLVVGCALVHAAVVATRMAMASVRSIVFRSRGDRSISIGMPERPFYASHVIARSDVR